MVISGRDDEFAPIMDPLTAEDIICLHHRWAAIDVNYRDDSLMRLLERDAYFHTIEAIRRRMVPESPI